MYYKCSQEINGCMATAVVNVANVENETKYIVKKWATVEEHNNEGDFASILVERIIMEMSDKVKVHFT